MSPRSRLLLIVSFLLVAVVCARLGFWQVGRLKERRAANTAALAARSAPPIVLDRSARGSPRPANRRVQAAGRYDHSRDIVIRGRVYGGVPGVEIVSPLLLRGGKMAVLVNRGFVPAPDAVTVEPDSLREPGEVVVEGIALPLPSGGGAPLQYGRRVTWARLDQEALHRELPYPVYPFYIRQTPDSALPRFPRRLDLPELDDGPNLSYAIQWFSFSIIALVFGVVMGRGKREQNKSVNSEP
jgi:surfeit locus 1 family protein